MAAVNVGDGKSCFLWQDMWLNHIPKLNFPELYSFATNTQITLYDALSAPSPPDLFHLPISDTALQQLIVLAKNLNSLADSEELDLWSYIWGSPFFSSAKAYKHLTGHMVTGLFMQHLNGFGNHAAKTSTKSFSGYF